MRNINCQVLSGVDTASQNGSQVDSNQLVSASFQAVFGDATAVGTFKIQGSNDISNDRYQPSQFTVGNWTDIPSATTSITAGASAIILIPNMSFRWVRAVYVFTSGGSSTITVNMNALSE